MAKKKETAAKEIGSTKERPPKPKKPGKPGGKDGPGEGEPPEDPKGGDDPGLTTTERTKHLCKMDATDWFAISIGSVPTAAGRRRARILVTVSSNVICDPGTKGHCEYAYTASAAFQQQNAQRKWVPFPGRNAFLHKFAIKKPVNSTETPDRQDRQILSMTDWFPKAPQKEPVEVEFKIVASVRGKWVREVKRKLTLCVPKLDNPVCPEP